MIVSPSDQLLPIIIVFAVMRPGLCFSGQPLTNAKVVLETREDETVKGRITPCCIRDAFD